MLAQRSYIIGPFLSLRALVIGIGEDIQHGYYLLHAIHMTLR